MQVTINKLSGPDAGDYRDLRLECLAAHPEAFGSSFEEECKLSLEDFAQRLEQHDIFGARRSDTNVMVGTVGLHLSAAAKLRHKGLIVGMYVRPEMRGSGVGAALVQHVLDYARPIVEQVNLVVEASNVGACGLYRKLGFEQYGYEPRARKVGQTYYDDVLMALALRDGQA